MVRNAGTPKREIQVEMNTLVQVAAVIKDKGTASNHLEVLSIMVKKINISLACRQQSHQIQMHVRKTSSGNFNTRNQRLDVGPDLTLLALEAGPCPEANIL